jgi:fibronectin-binding autotransporter adhesin
MKTPYLKSRRAILTGSILPVALVTSAYAANITWNGTAVSLNNNPAFVEGLQEGFINANNDFTTPIGSAQLGPNFGESLNLRMGQSTLVGPTAWQDNRTWLYAGEIFTGPNGIISIAANNDDTDFFRIDGSIVLQNTAWDQPNATVVTGLVPNTWVPFEYRVANGTGGAGPSGQNNAGGVGWTNTIGVVMSYDDEGGSVVVGNYSGGNGLGQPAEVQDGTATLFRYNSGGGIGGDNVTVTASTTVTMSGTGNTVNENFLRLQGAATNTLTLTVDSSDAQIRTLAANLTGTAWVDGSTAVFSGSANVRLGQTQDSTFTGNFIIKNGGTGELIFDNAANDLDGTTLRVVDGRVSIKGNAFNPISTLSTPIEILGANAKLRFGAVGFDTRETTFNNSIQVNESGTLEHVSPRMDTIGGTITIAPTKQLNADITGGILRVLGGVTGPAVNKTGGGTLLVTGVAALENLTVNAGRIALNGPTTLNNIPTIAPGATLTFGGGVGATYTVPSPFAVPTGNLEVFPTVGPLVTNLTGGTLTLNAPHGLLGEFWNVAPTNTNNFNPNWGIEALTQGTGAASGVNTPGAGDFALFQATFAGLNGGVPGFSLLSSNNDVQTFNYPGTNQAPFAALDVNYTDNIQARFSGKIFIPTGGVYGFSTTSDDGSAVFIDGASVVYNNRFQGMTNRGGSVFLTAGFHDIAIGMYEGGGDAGLLVFMTPPGGSAQLLDNSNLFPNLDAASFTNPITIQENSTINTSYVAATHSDITIQSTKTLTTTGNPLSVTSLKMRTADGTYNINTSGAGNVLTALAIDDNSGARITINKTGAGLFVLDNTTTAQLTNGGSIINLNEGTLGVLLQTGGLNPTGNATINYNGGGLVLSSKGGNQTFNLPPVFGGTNPAIEARKIGTGVAGPVTVTLNGNLKIPTGQVLNLKTADNYVMNIGGTADLSSGVGTVSVNGGRVDASANAVTGLNVAFGTASGTTGTFNLRTAAPSIASLSGGKTGLADLVIGDGASNSALTINQSIDTEFGGRFSQDGATVASVIKQGTGTLTLSGTGHNYSGGLRIDAGTVVSNAASLGTGAVILNGGTLATVSNGLLGEYWDSTAGGDGGAQAGFSTDLAAFNTYFAGKGVPTVTAPTTTANRQILRFSAGTGLNGGGLDTAPYEDQGFTATDTMAVRFSGNFVAPVAGDYTFLTRSDDGSVLFIDGVKVVNNNNYQGMTNATGVITLTAGVHTISVGMYEGTGGAGLEVRFTAPGGADQFLSNDLLTSSGLTATNAVNLQATSTIDPRGGTASFGVLTAVAGATLNALPGNVNFTGTNLSTTTGGTYEINKTGSGVLSLGPVASNGAANPVTLRKIGDGTAVMGIPTGPQFANATDVVAVAGGRLVTIAGSNGINPLGLSTVQLSNGGTLFLSTTELATTVPNAFTVNGTGTIAVGNAGFGAVDGSAVTIGSALNIAAPNTLSVSASNNYTLNLSAISGTGNLTAAGGTINAPQPISVNELVVDGRPAGANAYATTLNLNNGLTASKVTVKAGGVARQVGAFNTTGDTEVETNGELQVNGGSPGTNVVLKGGVLRAQTGVTDFGNRPINATAPAINQDRLRGVLDLTSGGLAPNNDGGILTVQLREPDAVAPLFQGEVNIPQSVNADAAFGSIFNSTEVAAGRTFTAVFFGRFTAATPGLYQFQSGSIDDNGAFWLDLNNNGLFESAGSAGNELISANQVCCGDAPLGEVTLVGGQTYNVAFGVEDTGGQSGYIARFKRPTDAPGDPMLVVNPAAQPGIWSSLDATTGGAVVVEGGAEIRTSRVSNASIIALTGANARLTLNSGAAVSDNAKSLTALAGTVAGGSTLEIGANNSLTVDSLSVANDATLIKTGAGTLTATTQSLGARVLDPLAPALQVNAGVVNLNGASTAFRDAAQGAANSGNLLINGGTVNVNGSISGAVTVNAGGRLSGVGTVGATTINGTPGVPGLLAPGDGLGAINTGTLLLTSDARIELQLGGISDLVNVNGDLTLDGFLQVINVGGVTDGTYRIMNYTGVLTDLGLDLDPTFTAIFPGSFISIATQNQVNLVVVPEPTAFAALFGGIGLLAGLRRFRRS